MGARRPGPTRVSKGGRAGSGRKVSDLCEALNRKWVTFEGVPGRGSQRGCPRASRRRSRRGRPRRPRDVKQSISRSVGESVGRSVRRSIGRSSGRMLLITRVGTLNPIEALPTRGRNESKAQRAVSKSRSSRLNTDQNEQSATKDKILQCIIRSFRIDKVQPIGYLQIATETAAAATNRKVPKSEFLNQALDTKNFITNRRRKTSRQQIRDAKRTSSDRKRNS